MKPDRGRRNLTILGVLAILITIATTSVSLAIYRLSGDIYLDRSRPGYLPDEDEAAEGPATNDSYNFPDFGELTGAELDKYLEELKAVNQRLDNFAEPYTPGPLSNESLGIPSELPEE